MRFEELDWQQTPIGEISLRRRIEPSLHVEVPEVLLGEEYLMSSLFTVAEVELARLGLAAAAGDALDVVVGGPRSGRPHAPRWRTRASARCRSSRRCRRSSRGTRAGCSRMPSS